MNQKTQQREETKRAFLAALGTELLSPGRLTVEGVAAAARANKALIYRYFGGLAGLIAAYAESPDFMPGAKELLKLCPGNMSSLSPRKRFACCIKAYIAALAARPVTVQVLLRLQYFDPPTLKALQAGRARGIKEIRRAFGAPDKNQGFDPDLAFNLIISGACHLLGARRAGWTEKPVPAKELAARLADTMQAIILSPR